MNEHDDAITFDRRPQNTGAWLVEIVVVALVIQLIAYRFGLAISLSHFAVAIGAASILHFVGRIILRSVLRRQ
jgi:hypothetical protein